MEKIFVNHTNHPSANWSAEQTLAARFYGEIVDMPFSAVSAEASADEVREMVQVQLGKILSMKPATVLCQGEFTYTFAMIERLKNLGVNVMAATSARAVSVEILPDGSTRQVSTFNFVQFREY